MRPLSISLIFLVFAFLASTKCLASSFGNMRIGGAIGFGQAGAENQGTTRVQGPLGFATFVDYSIDPRLAIGAEHERSMDGASTAIGFTGLAFKWYFWTPQPQWLVNSDDQIERSLLVQKNLVPYIGMALGFAQASFPETSSKSEVMVVGPYLSIKGGLEYPLSGRWGARSEFVYGATVGGTGNAEVMHLLLGIYYFFGS